ncbi:MAG TPA: hypothetical protein VIJ85_02480 [Rhizomicrobium sp.]
MRKILIAAAFLTGTLSICGPAFAGDVAAPVSGSEMIPIVAPGEQIGIACDALSVAQANSDVRVVLTVSAMPGDVAPGYKKVLATDQQVSKGSVHVKVPNTPDIANHTYDLSVYVVDPRGAQSCDAGAVKVSRAVSMLDKPDYSHHS